MKYRVLSDCNWTRTQNHLVRKRTLNHLAKLTYQLGKWSIGQSIGQLVYWSIGHSIGLFIGQFGQMVEYSFMN